MTPLPVNKSQEGFSRQLDATIAALTQYDAYLDYPMKSLAVTSAQHKAVVAMRRLRSELKHADALAARERLKSCAQ